MDASLLPSLSLAVADMKGFEWLMDIDMIAMIAHLFIFWLSVKLDVWKFYS